MRTDHSLPSHTQFQEGPHRGWSPKSGFLRLSQSKTTKEGHLSVPFHLLSLLFLLRDGDGLAGVADLESRKSPDGNVLAQFADLGRDQLRDRNSLVLDEGLLVEADLLVELGHLAFDHLLGNVCGLAAGDCLRAEDILLALVSFGRDIFLADKLRVAGRDVHGDVVHQFFEVLGASDEIALTVDLYQYADLSAGMDVLRDGAFAGHTCRLLLRGRRALLAENDNRLLAVHHRGAGGVAEFFDLCCGDVHGRCAHNFVVSRWSLVVGKNPNQRIVLTKFYPRRECARGSDLSPVPGFNILAF